MGKAIIKSNQGNGRYVVDIEFDTRRSDARKQVLEESIAKIEDETLPEMEEKEEALFDGLQDALETLDTYLYEGNPEDPGYIGQLNTLTVAALNSKFEYDNHSRNLDRIELKLLSQQKELEKLNVEAKRFVQRPAWCLEFNENLTGEVGTIESDFLVEMRSLDGEPEKDPILLPRAYDADNDGMLQTVHSSGPASTFFNLAIYPGMQKHQPRYRVGTITSLDKNNNTASVSLDVATRDPDENSLTYVQDFKPVSFNNVLNHIPVEYMTCNAKAFEVGDRVVVGFGGEWGNGKVVGFEANPRRCEPPVYIIYDYDKFNKGATVSRSGQTNATYGLFGSQQAWYLISGSTDLVESGIGTSEHTKTTEVDEKIYVLSISGISSENSTYDWDCTGRMNLPYTTIRNDTGSRSLEITVSLTDGETNEILLQHSPDLGDYYFSLSGKGEMETTSNSPQLVEGNYSEGSEVVTKIQVRFIKAVQGFEDESTIRYFIRKQDETGYYGNEINENGASIPWYYGTEIRTEYQLVYDAINNTISIENEVVTEINKDRNTASFDFFLLTPDSCGWGFCGYHDSATFTKDQAATLTKVAFLPNP